ncbi:hypothetical protein LPJ73_004247, partial [Coemansia sp. RSA 2703]
MSASVVTGASVNPTNSKTDTSPSMASDRSPSSAVLSDDHDSIIDFEDELQQELENEIDASFDSLFADDHDTELTDSASVARLSAPADRPPTEYSVDDEFDLGDSHNNNGNDNDEDEDDDDDDQDDDEDDEDIDFDFEDPSIPISTAPTNLPAVSKPPVYIPTNGSHPRVIEDEDDDEDTEDDEEEEEDEEDDVEQSDSASEDEFEAVDFAS